MKSITRTSALTFGLTLILSLALAGCHKDPAPTVPTDDLSSETNYFTCDNDSLPINIVVVMRSAYMGNVMDWSFKLSDSQILKLYTTRNLLSAGSWSFTTESEAYNGADGVFGVYMEGFEEEALREGSIEVKIAEGMPQYTLSATTRSGRKVRMHYHGEVHDLTHPIGSGSFVYGETSRPLDIAYSQLYLDLYEYAFSDTLSGIGVTFYSTTPFSSGNYTISDDMQAVDAGSAINLYLYIEDATSPLIGDVTNGSAAVTIHDNRIDISFHGELEGTSIRGEYSGRLEHLGSSILK